MTQRHKVAAACLVGVVASLLLVGAVSATFIRHVIQVLPIVLALAAIVYRPQWGPYAAIPIFMFWLLLMCLIWLYLIGVRTFFTGSFSTTEVVLTVLIGLFSAAGIVACVRSKPAATAAGRTVATVAFGVLQIGAMWVSMLRPFANR